MKINIERKNNDFNLVAENETGNNISMDAAETTGGSNLGMRPIELLPAAVGGCSCMDIISILKKQKQEIEDLQVMIESERENGKTMNLYTKIHLHYLLTGNLDKIKVERAINLSINRYCSAAETMRRAGTAVTWSYSIQN